MTKFQSDRPKFEAMDKDALIVLLDSFRESLRDCEDAGEFCLSAGEALGVDVEAGAYDEDESP